MPTADGTLRKDGEIPLSLSPNLIPASHLQSAIDYLVDDSQQALLQQQQQQQQQLHRRLGLGAISEESGVEAMRRERELLIRRIQTLESKVNSGKEPGGIVHSVQIKNGGNGGEAELGHQVNIEINPPKQQQQKQQQQPAPPGAPPPPHQRYSHPSPKVSSVVNLGFHPEEPRGARQRTGSFSSNAAAVKALLPSGDVRPAKRVPSSAGRIAVPSAVGSRIGGRLLSNNRTLNPKSRSVENLFDGSQVNSPNPLQELTKKKKYPLKSTKIL